MTSRLCQQSNVEFGEKIFKFKPKTTTFYSPMKAPETQKIVCLLWIRELQCTMLNKGELSSDTIGYFEKVQKTICDLPRTGAVQTNEEAQVYVQDLDMFVTVQLLEETPAVLLLHQLCSKRGCSYEWKTAKLHNWPKKGKTITCIMDTFVPLVVPGLSSSSSSILSSTSRSTDQSYYARKLATLSDPVTTRSDKHACGKPMLTDHDKQATGNREPADETNTEDPTQGIPVWSQPFTVHLEDLEYMCSHIPLKE